jgi:hypothetical protein
MGGSRTFKEAQFFTQMTQLCIQEEQNPQIYGYVCFKTRKIIPIHREDFEK